MTKKESIKLFEEKKVRTVWDDEQEKWYFSISDIVEVLTDSKDPKQYIKKMKSRDSELKSNWGTICTLVQMTSEDGKKHKRWLHLRKVFSASSNPYLRPKLSLSKDDMLH